MLWTPKLGSLPALDITANLCYSTQMKPITKDQIHRAVASSTAIETEHDTEYWLGKLRDKDMDTKINTQYTVKIDPYPIIERAVEEGCHAGWNKAHKHVGKPDKVTLLAYIEDAIMLNLSEIMMFNEEDV